MVFGSNMLILHALLPPAPAQRDKRPHSRHNNPTQRKKAHRPCATARVLAQLDQQVRDTPTLPARPTVPLLSLFCLYPLCVRGTWQTGCGFGTPARQYVSHSALVAALFLSSSFILISNAANLIHVFRPALLLRVPRLTSSSTLSSSASRRRPVLMWE